MKGNQIDSIQLLHSRSSRWTNSAARERHEGIDFYGVLIPRCKSAGLFIHVEDAADAKQVTNEIWKALTKSQ